MSRLTQNISTPRPCSRLYQFHSQLPPIRSVIDQVEVDDTEIRIVGRRQGLERLMMGGGASPAGVPSFVRKWRARRVSNS